jgi:hypothetical protein
VKGLLPGRGPAGRAPGRAPWPPGRGAPGRSPRSPRPWPPWPGPPAGRGAPGRGAWEAGRGAPGRGPEPWPWPWEAGAAGAAGGAVNSGVVGAGDAGAGRGAGAGFGPGVGREPGAAGAAGAAGLSAAAGLGAGGRGAAGRAACAGEGAAGLAGAALRAGAALPPPLPCWRASVNLRTTGASMVEDAERTNSPSSWSLAMTTLLSTPNSLASSYTRTLATSLLLGPGASGPSLLHGRTHRVLIECSSQSRPTSNSRGTRAARGFRATLLTVLPAQQLSVCSTYWRNAFMSSAPGARNALVNARRRTAWSRQTRAGCTYAPRPGSVPRGSGTHASPIATMRSRSVLAARCLQPTQVRSGHARAGVRPDTLKSTSPYRPHPLGAAIERLLS